MKTLTLILILSLHATNLWPHLSAASRNHLVSLVSDSSSAARTASSSSLSPAQISPLPIRISTAALNVPAASAIAVDSATATVLYAKNVGARRPIASVTKMITVLTILSDHSLNETITVPSLPIYPSDAEIMGLTPGDTFRLGDLVKAALIPSDNDAADTLAIATAGSIPKFAAKMNAKMALWGITDTRFVSASGLQDTGNYASAAALAKIASLAIQNPDIARIVATSSAAITSGQGRVYNLRSTNDLLASGDFYGIKTGYTEAAGECFVGLTRINGHQVITVVLGADDRFGATITLTNWIGQTWQWL